MENCIVFHPASLLHKTAVTLVAHGLNLKPGAMMPLVTWLNKHGSDVYLIQLSGHYEGGVAIGNITSSVWQGEMRTGYETASRAAIDGSVPLFFLGYSLGALLAQSMVALPVNTSVFQKQVLIAPAIAIRRRAYLLKLLFFWGRKSTLPSFSPKAYRVNNSLPLLFYKILFHEEKKLWNNSFSNANIPTLIMIDPKDELISYKQLEKQIARFKLTNYRLMILEDDLKERNTAYHHLIIDEQTMGKKNWEIATKEISMFLFGQ